MNVLFVNFHESPENFHFEQSLIKYFNASGKNSLDIIHDFKYTYPYNFFSQIKNQKGFRIGPVTSPSFPILPHLKTLLRNKIYTAILFLDFPKRKNCLLTYMYLVKSFQKTPKIFIANHLAPEPGQLFSSDLARNLKLLKLFSGAFVFDYDNRGKWEGFGISPDKIFKRPFCVDCNYYSPEENLVAENYVFSAGSAGRDFETLFKLAEIINLKILSDTEIYMPQNLRNRIEVLPFSKNLHNLKKIILKSKSVVIPVKDEYANVACGNSIAFISMASGKVVLCRKTRYFSEFIKDGINGFTYTKLAEVPEKMSYILRLNSQKIKKLEKNARQTILKKGNLDIFIRQLIDTLCQKD